MGKLEIGALLYQEQDFFDSLGSMLENGSAGNYSAYAMYH